MPAQDTTSTLGKKLGARVVKAHAAVKDKPAESQGGGEVPAGVEGGIAKLVSFSVGPMKKGKNAGKDMVSLRGIAVAPDFLPNGQKVAGLGTSVMFPLCDTPDRKGTQKMEDHWDNFTNAVKLLAGDEALAAIEVDPKLPPDKQAQQVIDGTFQIVKDLIEGGCTFSFRTWIGEATAEYPNPRTNHVWDRACEWAPEGQAADPGGGVDTPDEGEAPAEEPAAEEPSIEAESEAPTDGVDLGALLAAADKDSTGKTAAGRPAVAKLKELGIAAGMTEEDIDNAENWGAVVEFINSAGASAEEAAAEPEPEPEAPWEPAKGDVVKYALRGKDGKVMAGKDKKPIKASDHEVLTVSAKNRTVTLKRLSDEKPVLGADKKPYVVSWDHVAPAETA